MAEKKNFETMTKQELIEMLNREQKLARNRKFLETLPDKGKKIKDLVERLTRLIAVREQIDATASKFQELNISQPGAGKNRLLKLAEIDSDDEDDEEGDKDMLEFATPMAKDVHKPKKLEKEKNPAGKKRNEVGDLSTRYIVQRWKEAKEKPTNTWDYDSAVTPPQYKHQKAKLIPMQESFTLQQEQQKKQEQLQAEHAAKRLKEQNFMPGLFFPRSSLPPSQTTSQYRDTNVINYDSDNASDDEEDVVGDGVGEGDEDLSDID